MQRQHRTVPECQAHARSKDTRTEKNDPEVPSAVSEAHQHKNDVGAGYSGVWKLAPNRFHPISRGWRSLGKLSRWQQLGPPARVARLPEWAQIHHPLEKLRKGKVSRF